MIQLIAFDADDTLWTNQDLYDMTQERFAGILSRYHDRDWVVERLFEVEMRNLQYFGYGIKAFTLSMIETAIELTEGRITGGEIQNILDYAHQMMRAPVQLLPDVREVVAGLADRFPLMIITKGDLLDQQSKVARSGLGDYFQAVEIVSHKTPRIYADILGRFQLLPGAFVMVGNSLKSDILPVVEIGAQAVHIPYHSTWAHEEMPAANPSRPAYHEIEKIRQLPPLLTHL